MLAMYIGTKIIHAEPMRANEFKVRPLVYSGECQDGYQVTYEDGYISWSPKDVFEKAYRKSGNMTFGMAIEALKLRNKVARNGWNGKEMYITLIPAGNATFQGYNMQDCIGMKTADYKMQPGWLASQTDMLAEDWYIVE